MLPRLDGMKPLHYKYGQATKLSRLYQELMRYYITELGDFNMDTAPRNLHNLLEIQTDILYETFTH